MSLTLTLKCPLCGAKTTRSDMPRAQPYCDKDGAPLIVVKVSAS
jgi:endogenous inhibitor of DNA gyrase (YacG/DUF329 family)